MTDPLGQSQVIPYLAGLTKLGYSFTILSAEKPERFRDNGEFIRNLLGKSGIKWEPIMYTATPPVISTVQDTRKLIKMANLLHKREQFSMVHCRGHYVTSIAGLSLKKKYGIKYLFDMRGFWADERIDGGLWNLSNPLYRTIYNYFKRKEKQFFEQADYTISLTEAGKREIHSWKNLNNQPVKIDVIPCCADLDLFSYQNIDQGKLKTLKADLGYTETDRVITYLGSVGTWYMLDEMLRLFAKIKAKHPAFKILFVTPDDPAIIFDKANDFRVLPEDIMVRKAARADVPYYIALGTASMFFVKQAYSKLASSPTKMGEIMGMGVPLICNSGVGDVKDITLDTGAGICLEDFTETELERAAANFDQLLSIPKEKIRDGALKYYALDKGIEKYAAVYAKLLN